MAGAPGFEPGNAGTKNRCLTAWRRPNLQVRRGGASNGTRRRKRRLISKTCWPGQSPSACLCGFFGLALGRRRRTGPRPRLCLSRSETFAYAHIGLEHRRGSDVNLRTLHDRRASMRAPAGRGSSATDANRVDCGTTDARGRSPGNRARPAGIRSRPDTKIHEDKQLKGDTL